MNVLHIVGLIFMVLKLTGTIDWSWWLVLSPFIVLAFIGGIQAALKDG